VSQFTTSNTGLEDRCQRERQRETERARLEKMSKNHKDREVVSEEKNRESEKEK